MAHAEATTLTRIVEQRLDDFELSLDASDFFERYVPMQVLKELDLSYEEVNYGVVDGGNDGGIDAFYTFVNGILTTDDLDPRSFRRDVVLQVHIFQTKFSPAFKENVVDRLVSSVVELLDPETDLESLASAYNQDLLGHVANFQRVYRDLLTQHPRLEISVYYASSGHEVHPNVKRRTSRLYRDASDLFTNSNVQFEFLTARDLLNYDSRPLLPTLTLQLAEMPISIAGEGFVGLVRLHEFFEFLTDDEEHLRNSIFDANVRDYQESNTVNRAIRGSLESSNEDFWWLNNGVTIICTAVSQSSKLLTISDAQVVNGLQTSIELQRYFQGLADEEREEDTRCILVRVLRTDDEQSRDRVITATNSQTSIPHASLRATDPIQRHIEQHLLARGLYYDRRKNQQKNLNRPAEKIISIPFLAQSVMAILLQESDNSRARPSNVIKEDDDYRRVFSEDYPLDVFYKAALAMKRIDEFMKSPAAHQASQDRNNVKWHLAMFSCAHAVEKPRLAPTDLERFDTSLLKKDLLASSLDEVWAIYRRLSSELESADRAAKSREMVGALKTRLSELHGTT